MGQITADQSQTVMATLAMNVDWKSIGFEALKLQDAIIRNAAEAGKQFELFLKNRARFIIGDPKSILTKPFNPSEFIGKGWATWKGPIDGDGLSGEEDIDTRSASLSEIEIAKFIFETCLKSGEKSITGEEKLRRLKEKSDFIRFGDNVFLGLRLNYQANKENSILELIHRNFKIIYIDFPGQVLRGPNGDRDVLCLCRDDDGEWSWHCRWLGNDWNAVNPSVGCKSQS